MDIEKYWKTVISKDELGMRELFDRDAIVKWPCTKEQFTKEEFIRANCDYPGEWDGAVERIEQTKDLFITTTNVFAVDHSISFHVASFIRLKDDKVIELEEYWADDGPAKEWRINK